jgi:thiol-disulfide isomerase/thioredoxin
MYPARLAILTFLMVPALSAQTTDSQSPDGLHILRQMSEHYAGGGPWYIEAIEERTSQMEYSRQWTKNVMIGAVSGNQYHFEGHSETGSALHISDGKTAWDLHPKEHAYMQEPASAKGYQQPKMSEINEWSAQGAVQLRKDFADLSKHYESATRLPDEVIFARGIEIPCHLVKLDTTQRKGPKAEGFSSTETLWIDKAAWTVRKTVRHDDTFISSGPVRIPMVQDTVTTYEIAELNGPVPDALFHLEPPADAKLVSKFNDGFGGPDLTGEAAPDVQLVGANGKQVPLSSYRGKPVLLDLWATWCAPCVASMPMLAELNREAAPKGLVTLSVDEDEEPNDATDFLAKNRYTWPNTHDDGKIGDAFKKTGIPLIVLIDAQGKIVFYDAGGDDAGLRKALASLGPEYASLAAPQKPSPCETASK